LTKDRLIKTCAVVMAVCVLAVLSFYWIGGDQLRFRGELSESVSPMSAVGEIVAGTELRQRFVAEGDRLEHVQILFSTYGRENTAVLEAEILDPRGESAAKAAVDPSTLKDNAMAIVPFPEGVPLERGGEYTLRLTCPEGAPGNAVTVWYGSAVAAARSQVSVEIPEGRTLTLNGAPLGGMLAFRTYEITYLRFLQYYWYMAALALLAVGAVLWRTLVRFDRGESTVLLRLLEAFRRYNYLLRQLIARDFKTKYKRSVLGILWSFLNPLLTMSVQYLVFSTLFKSDIHNFPLYLLTGIVCFGFFSEASSMSLMSIVGNASLITKVYVPKYIYPVSRVLSSTVNLLLSLIPLLGVMVLTGTPFRASLLLLPFGLLCLVAFSLGVGFVLSTMMVFFRDTQFLWGVVSMLWMYLTPIFYPESIIPARLMTLFKCNPLYHIIRFVRIVLIDGVSPEPKAYGLCLLASFVPLVIGALIFRKNQDKFVLNL